MIAQGGLCAKSQVYRVAERFITKALAGLADRREDNGARKLTRVYESELLRLVEQSPQKFGYRRPTWTQELLILVLAERLAIAISVSAMSRLLGRLGIGLKRPKPIVSCPWKKVKTRVLGNHTSTYRAMQQASEQRSGPSITARRP
jgi:transposase